MRLFENAPRADPYLENDGMSQAESAEECATSFKRLLYSIRICYLDDKALDRALDGANDFEKPVVNSLVSNIDASPKSPKKSSQRLPQNSSPQQSPRTKSRRAEQLAAAEPPT